MPWGDVDGWKAFSMSTGQRAMWAMWAMVPAAERDESGRVVVWQDMRSTLGTVA